MPKINPDPKFARRRALVLAPPVVLAGAALYVPNALAGNGATFLGPLLMIGAVVAVLLDTERAGADR